MSLPGPDRILASLDAFRVLPAWLVDAMDGDRVASELATDVPQLADGSIKLIACTPERLRAKGDLWLARYRVTVAEPGTGARDVVLVGKLYAPNQSNGAPPADGSGGFGEPGWTGWLPSLRLELAHQPHDEALPALPMIVEPAAAAELIEGVLNEAGYGRVRVVDCVPEVVRYKPGSRCTVVVRLRYAERDGGGQPPSPIVLKTHQGGKGEVAWSAMRALWDRQATWRDTVDLAEPLAYLVEPRILVQGPLAEELTLKELARAAISTRETHLLDRLRVELDATARALAEIHGCGARYGRSATLEEELAEAGGVIARLARTNPELGSAGADLLDALRQRSRAESADPEVPAHHDFRPAQVLLNHGRIGFIDFDGASMSEPALDLGRFRAKLRDIGISTVAFTADHASHDPPEAATTLALLDDLCEGFLAAYQAHRPVSRTRVALWETVDLLTAVLHAWTKVRRARIRPRMTALVHQVRHGGLFD